MKKTVIGIAVFLLCIFIIAIVIGGGNEDDAVEFSQKTDETVHLSSSDNDLSVKDNRCRAVIEDDTCIRGDSILNPNSPSSSPSQILTRFAYATSYNHDTKCPNWVAWHLKREHLDGPYSRNGVPYCDENRNVVGIGVLPFDGIKGDYILDVEAEEPRQKPSDWPDEKYGMTHGHICPAGDNTWSKVAMNQSFLLTNICPQTEKLNGGGWKKLEEKCRRWAQRFGDIYIVAGPVFDGGVVRRTFGESNVAVPDAFFKVVLCMNGQPKAIGFIYPNDDESHSMMDQFCSVDDVEKNTGMDFFASLPDDVENEIEATTAWKEWQ